MRTLTGTRRLIRLALRRDRILLPVWLASLTALVVGVVASVIALYATEEERAVAAAFSAANRVARVFDGPAAGIDTGSLAMVETYGFVAILIALMSAQAIVRHTRQDEEAGRAELIGAGVVGRHARLAAALVVTLGTNLLLGILITAGLLATGLPLSGSVLSGAAFAGIGFAFAGVAAIAAQIAGEARGANAMSGAVLGVAFLLRAVGDAVGEVAPSGVELISAWPSWLSPIGWGQQVRPYSDANAWILGLFVVTAAVGVVVAFVLTDHRDVGRGMISVRPGPPRAARSLLSPLGLAWRQQRNVLLWWTLALVSMGAAFGIVGEGADELITASEQFGDILAQLGGGDEIVDAFFAFLMRLIAIVAAGYTVQALLRLRAEESAGRVEPLLGTAVSRSRWMLSHVGIAAAGTAGLLALTGAATGLAYGLAIGDLAGGFGGPASAALVQIPAALTLGAAVVVVFAVAPRYVAAVAWAGLGSMFVIGQFGEALGLPQAVRNLSPFTHPPLLPLAEPTAAPVVVLTVVALILTVLGLGLFRRRDLAM